MKSCTAWTRCFVGKLPWEPNGCLQTRNLISRAVAEEGEATRRAQPDPPTFRKAPRLMETGVETVIYESDGSFSVLEKNINMTSTIESKQQIMDLAKSAFLPRGYPHSVSPDYVEYQLWALPTHLTGWISMSLVTSSMLRAVGVGAGPVGAVATAAAIKWITKDGVGAIGRLLVGGRLGDVFDEDPRRWRMASEGVGTIGLALEILTAFFPQHFLILASTGNLAKAVGKGMGRPSFRVIQQHFSRGNNVGEVAAKEEVWEVVAQVAGLLASVGLLSCIEENGQWQWVLGVWIAVHSAHVILRYVSLYTLQLDSINLARGKRLALHHIQGTASLPDIRTLNREELYILDWAILSPCIHIGCSISESFSIEMRDSMSFGTWQSLFSKERYLLSWHDNQGWVVLKEGAERLDILKAVYHCVMLNEAGGDFMEESELRSSIMTMDAAFPDFVENLVLAGWDVDQVVIKSDWIRVKTID